MNVHHIFLVHPDSLALLNAFILKGQKKVQEMYSLDLKSLDKNKTVHIGSLETENSHLQLTTNPPHLIKLHLLLSLDNKCIKLYVNLSSEEIMNCTITPTIGIKLDSQDVPVTKYSSLQNKPIYADMVMIKSENLMLYNKIQNKQYSMKMSFDLTSQICYIAEERKIVKPFEIETDQTVTTNPFITDSQSNEKKQEHSFTTSTSIKFIPIHPPWPHFVASPHLPNHQTRYRYLPEVRIRNIQKAPIPSQSVMPTSTYALTHSSTPHPPSPPMFPTSVNLHHQDNYYTRKIEMQKGSKTSFP